MAPALLDRLGLRLGDTIRIGDGSFVLRATLTHEPDGVSGVYRARAARVMVASAALPSTGLIAPGTLVEYCYRVRLAAGADVGALRDRRREAAFPDAGWRIREFSERRAQSCKRCWIA